jgi:hypothetical protein
MPTGFSAGPNSLQQLGDFVGMSARPISLKAVALVFGISVPFSFKKLLAEAASRIVTNARELIQISRYSNVDGGVENYGVAPDFACGYTFHLPAWTGVPTGDGVSVVNRKSQGDLPSFFLGIIKFGDFILLEAFDTWRNSGVSFEKFQQHVTQESHNIRLRDGGDNVYTTFNGNLIHFYMTYDTQSIFDIEYGVGNFADTLVDAGNYTDQSQFLSGNILKSAADAVVEIHNPYLEMKITLDWGNPSHLVRTSEDGTVEQAGRNDGGQLYEVWVDFDWNGPTEGDFYRPFNQLASAVAAVADGGVIKIAPGTTRVRGPILGGKRMKVVAPLGDVTIGAR